MLLDKIKLDDIDRAILTCLYEDARLTTKALSEKVGLSQPACAERVRKMVDAGVIGRYTLQISPEALGYTMAALVRVRPMPGRLSQVEALIKAIPQIVQCDKVTGDDSYVCRIYLRSIQDLDTCLQQIADHATYSSSIIKSSPVNGRMLPLDLDKG